MERNLDFDMLWVRTAAALAAATTGFGIAWASVWLLLAISGDLEALVNFAQYWQIVAACSAIAGAVFCGMRKLRRINRAILIVALVVFASYLIRLMDRHGPLGMTIRTVAFLVHLPGSILFGTLVGCLIFRKGQDVYG